MNTREVGEPSRGARCRRMGGTGTVDVEDMSKMEKEWGGGEEAERSAYANRSREVSAHVERNLITAQVAG